MIKKLESTITGYIYCVSILTVLFFCVFGVQPIQAQTKEFSASKNLEIQYNILRELYQKYVDTVNIAKLVNVGIDAMLESLDPYTEYIPEEYDDAIELMTTASYGGIGSTIKKVDSLGVVITEPYLGSPAAKNGLEPGDIILKIDGKEVKPMSATECSNMMKGQPGTEVVFFIVKGRTGVQQEVKIKRERIHIPDISYSGIIKDKTGYIKLDGFTYEGSKDVKKAVLDLKSKGAEKLVLDLRGNGGGLMEEAINIISLFVPKGTKAVSQMGRDSSSLIVYKTTEEPVDTLMPLMVLVNSGSASSSEIVTGAMQDLDRAKIVGTRTFGKGLVQLPVQVGYNGTMKFTIAKYYTPSGRCVQAIDYSSRNEDGSVGYIPDSLKRAFKTKSGRVVYDGGGITPDIEIPSDTYSRALVSLVMNDVIGDYAVQYYKNHKTISVPATFSLTDAEYDDFVKFASKKNFDPRSSAGIQLEQMIKSAKAEDLYDLNKSGFDLLQKNLVMSKEQILKVKRDEIKPVVEQEIVGKYYYTGGKVESLLRSDEQLHKAIEKF